MERIWMPGVAGILNIVAGSIHLLCSMAAGIIIFLFIISSYYGIPGQENTALVILSSLTAVSIIISILSIVGGIFALRRTKWKIAVAGSICSILIFYLLTLGIVSIVLLVLSRQEFKRIH